MGERAKATVYVDREVHRTIKAIAALLGKEISELYEEGAKYIISKYSDVLTSRQKNL